MGWRQLLHLARWPPAASQGSGQAQQAVQPCGASAPLQLRRHASEVAAAQIPAQQAQRQHGQGGAKRQTGTAAHQAQCQRFPQHQRHARFGAQAQHRQQGKLLRPLGHAEGQHREHQKCAGEQRHQRQHREVDAVGARELAQPLGGVARLAQAQAGRPARRGLQFAHQGPAVGARAQSQVNAAELAGTAKQILRSADVHHRQRCAATTQTACHVDWLQALASLQRNPSTAQYLPGAGVQKDGVWCEYCQPVG